MTHIITDETRRRLAREMFLCPRRNCRRHRRRSWMRLLLVSWAASAIAAATAYLITLWYLTISAL